jgi:DNA polymerase-1
MPMITPDIPNKLFLLDAYALIFRAYYAFIRAPRIASTGLNTSAMFGFTNVLLDILKNEKPSHMAVVFDPHDDTLRVQEYPLYKANRDETPEDIKIAFPYILKIIEAFNIPIYQVSQYEADDVIGTLAKKAEAAGFTTYMMTSDKDYGQLVSDKIFVYRPGRQGNEAEILGVKEVCEKFGINHVEQVIDVLGMMGDAVDNIPGIPGIGEKTAAKLIQEFGSLEGLLANTDKLKGKQKENVEASVDIARLSRKLATILLDAPVELEEERLRVKDVNPDAIKAIFEELEFKTILKRVLPEAAGSATAAAAKPATKPAKKDPSQQPSLFDSELHVTSAAEVEAELLSGSSNLKTVVDSHESINALLAVLKDASSFCFDTETSDSEPINAVLIGMSFMVKPGETWYVVVPQDHATALALVARFKPIFEDEAKKLIAKNYKYDYQILKKYGIEVYNQVSGSNLKTLADVSHDYQLVDSPESISALLAVLKDVPSFCFDTETSDIEPINAVLVGMSFAVKPGQAWYVAVPQDHVAALALVAQFKPIFEDEVKELVAQNYKYDYKMLKKYGVEVRNQVFDTMIAHYLINPDGKHGMDFLSEIYLGYKPIPIEQLIGKKGKTQRSMADLKPAEIVDYAAEDADITLQLKQRFDSELDRLEARRLFVDVEVPLIKVLADMELEGVRINEPFLLEYSGLLESDIERLGVEIHEKAGMEFNIDSPKQLGELLFDRLKIASDVKKTKTGQYSTDEATLSKYERDHPIIGLVLNYRELRKLKSTYVDALPNMVNAHTGRVHTNYMQTVAATGRLSSNNPNLQNIPIRTPRGQEIRKAFIPRNEDYTILSADYSQVELRIIAALSKDENMIDAFLQGEDIHRATAAKVFGVPIAEVDKVMRSKAKAVNFGIIYGQGAFGLAQNLGIPRAEAKQIIDAYFTQFHRLKSYQAETIDRARHTGYVETILGRRRYLADINSANAVVRGFAERNAINAPIQGSAADIIKVAMIDIQHEMLHQGFRSKMVMQVHDELVFDVHKDELEALQPIIRERMMGAVQMAVPLEVEMNTGLNWLEAH